MRNSFARRVGYNWNSLPLAVASVPDQRAFKKTFDPYINP